MGQDEFKRPIINFKENKEEINSKLIKNESSKNEIVKLFFTLEGCIKDINYQIKIFSSDNKDQKYLSETEILKPNENKTIVFQKSYLLTYFFEKEQNLIFKIIINNDDKEEIDFKTSLGCIIGSKNSIICKNISNEREEKIKIKASKYDFSDKNKVKIHFIIQHDMEQEKENKSKKKSIHDNDRFFFKITSKNDFYKDLYTSETVSKDGYLKPVIIPILYLYPSFDITFYTIKKEVLTSFTNLTIEKIMFMRDSPFPFYYNIKKMKQIQLLLDCEIIGNVKTFLDYINQGMRINLTIAIDYSKSNEELHKLNKDKKKMNRFEEAIKYCGEIINNYTSDQFFPVWGFGADNIPNEFNGKCFPINFKEDPKIEKIDGVIEEYRNSLSKITFSEKSEISPVIKNFTQMIENDKNINEYYYILLLLTDGKYDDREKTIDEIVKASKLPMSIIIAGLEDFKGEFDIVYMIDATGSMGKYLKAAKDQCINISNELEKKFKDYTIKFGGVFYRDPIDCPKEKNEMIDLTDDVLSLKFYISGVKAIGGGDEAEDWAGGYDLAINKLKWRNGIKLIIHICDADGHGKEFTKSEDNHPDEGVKIPPLLEKCVENRIKVIGFNIKNGANTSFSEFKKIYDNIDKNRRGLYKYNDFKESENLNETFKDSVIEAATFAAMMELDKSLVNSEGEKLERNIVQFVSYDNYKNNPKLLAEKVLEAIPTQVVQYYNNKSIKEANKDGFLVVDDNCENITI